MPLPFEDIATTTNALEYFSKLVCIFSAILRRPDRSRANLEGSAKHEAPTGMLAKDLKPTLQSDRRISVLIPESGLQSHARSCPLRATASISEVPITSSMWS